MKPFRLFDSLNFLINNSNEIINEIESIENDYLLENKKILFIYFIV